MITSTNPFLMELYPQGYSLIAELHNDYYRRVTKDSVQFSGPTESELFILNALREEIGYYAGTIPDFVATTTHYFEGVDLHITICEVKEEITILQLKRSLDHKEYGKAHDTYYDARIAEYRAFLQKTTPLQGAMV